MSDKIKAADAISRLAQSYQAVIDAAAMLREIGSIEQAKDEAVKARAEADKEAAEAKAEAKKAKDVIKKAKDDAAQIIEGATATAKEMVANADHDAERIVENATLQGESIIQAARLMGERVSGDIVADTKRAEERFKEVLNQCDLLDQVIANRKAEVIELETRLAKAQAQVAKLLG